MDIGEIIQKAGSEGRSSLTEAESKQVLEAYGVPVVTETVVSTYLDAVEQAKKFGFPVVVKGLGSRITHKTERGLVYTKIANEKDLSEALQAIQNAAGDDLEGYLVQPQIEGNREFVAGLFRDDQFGPVVMFGLGGIFTEACLYPGPF